MDLVGYERRGPVSTLTMDDGKMNLQSIAMLEALGAALDRAQGDGTVVVLAGREGVFSAGFDLAVFKRGGDEQLRMLTLGARMTARLLSFPAPVVAACGGHAIAMGAFLLLSADVRFGVSNKPFKVAVNEVAIGLTLPRFATEVCRQRLAPAHFSRAPLTASAYDPQQAKEAGFLDELVPAAELLPAAQRAAEALAGLERKSHAATKLRVREQALAALRRAIDEDVADWSNRAG
jgi:enoyl-CoA hydratase